MARHLARLLRVAGQDMPEGKQALEINPQHALVRSVENETDGGKPGIRRRCCWSRPRLLPA